MPQTMMGAWECCRCKHIWAKRKDRNDVAIKPLRCADCGSAYWDRLPIEKIKTEEGDDGL